MDVSTLTIYTQMGGLPAFQRLVHTFYERVYADPELRPLFPTDQHGAEERLSLFLVQYFGGPTTYSDQRGHPRLRMRHMPFTIGKRERDLWLQHMLSAIDDCDPPPSVREAFLDYFPNAASFMMNH